MNIAGLLVHALPGRLQEVGGALGALPGVEVHTATEDGRLVVTVEETGGSTTGETVLAVQRIDGVLSAALVYHHFEPDPEAIRSEEHRP